MALSGVNPTGENWEDSGLVNENPEFNNPKYFRKMRYGYANAEKNYEKYNVASQLLRGTMTFSKDKLQELDPSYTGFTHVFVLRMPLFMKYIANVGRAESGFYWDNSNVLTGDAKADMTQDICRYHYRNLRALFEMGCTSYSGTPNLTLDTADINVGWSERNYAVPTKSQYDGNSFTLTVLETRGDPLRNGMEYYINSIFDATGKFSHMGGAHRTGSIDEPLELSLANYTFSFMIVQTDPSLLQIQNIDMWNNCFFTEAPRDNLDWTQGEIDIVQPRSVQFRGIYLPVTNNGPILKKAHELLQRRVLYYKRIEDLTEEDLRQDETESGSTSSGNPNGYASTAALR